MATSQGARDRRGAEELIPEGTGLPSDVPPDIFAAALRHFLACERLDMRALALELGIGRATLYRRVGGRDHLLGAVIWFLTRHAIARSMSAGEGLTGRERFVALNGAFMRDVHGQPALQRLLDAEPEAALRILTSKHGPVQQGLIDVTRRLLEEEDEHGALAEGIDRATLAYVIVRVGESFLYADVIADNDPDVDLAVEVIGRLLS
jgi:AcrR family transcriptional regulator